MACPRLSVDWGHFFDKVHMQGTKFERGLFTFMTMLVHIAFCGTGCPPYLTRSPVHAFLTLALLYIECKPRENHTSCVGRVLDAVVWICIQVLMVENDYRAPGEAGQYRRAGLVDIWCCKRFPVVQLCCTTTAPQTQVAFKK